MVAYHTSCQISIIQSWDPFLGDSTLTQILIQVTSLINRMADGIALLLRVSSTQSHTHSNSTSCLCTYYDCHLLVCFVLLSCCITWMHLSFRAWNASWTFSCREQNPWFHVLQQVFQVPKQQSSPRAPHYHRQILQQVQLCVMDPQNIFPNVPFLAGTGFHLELSNGCHLYPVSFLGLPLFQVLSIGA